MTSLERKLTLWNIGLMLALSVAFLWITALLLWLREERMDRERAVQDHMATIEKQSAFLAKLQGQYHGDGHE